MYDFNTTIPRKNTHAEKYDARVQKFGTNDVIPLWVADMDFPVSPVIQKSLLKRIEHPIYGYTDYYDEYYSSIERWMKKSHNWKIEREWILPINSVVTGLNFAVEVFTKKGDGVIIQPPIYAPFYSAVINHGREVLANELMLVDGEYQIDFEDFEVKAKRAKLFLFCSPHNPTGRVWSEDELRKLVDICKKNGVIIISDEVHADLVYEATHIPIATLDKDIVITLNSPAKSFNIMGIVSAYAVIENETLREKFHEPFKYYSLLHPNLLGLTATIAAYRESDEWLEALKNYLKENLDYIQKRLIAMPKIKAMPTEATFLLWLDCRGLGLLDEDLENFFIKEIRLGLNSGVSFGKGGEGFMRLNFAVPREKLVKVMDRLDMISSLN